MVEYDCKVLIDIDAQTFYKKKDAQYFYKHLIENLWCSDFQSLKRIGKRTSQYEDMDYLRETQNV